MSFPRWLVFFLPSLAPPVLPSPLQLILPVWKVKLAGSCTLLACGSHWILTWRHSNGDPHSVLCARPRHWAAWGPGLLSQPWSLGTRERCWSIGKRLLFGMGDVPAGTPPKLLGWPWSRTLQVTAGHMQLSYQLCIPRHL